MFFAIHFPVSGRFSHFLSRTCTRSRDYNGMEVSQRAFPMNFSSSLESKHAFVAFSIRNPILDVSHVVAGKLRKLFHSCRKIFLCCLNYFYVVTGWKFWRTIKVKICKGLFIICVTQKRIFSTSEIFTKINFSIQNFILKYLKYIPTLTRFAFSCYQIKFLILLQTKLAQQKIFFDLVCQFKASTSQVRRKKSSKIIFCVINKSNCWLLKSYKSQSLTYVMISLKAKKEENKV